MLTPGQNELGALQAFLIGLLVLGVGLNVLAEGGSVDAVLKGVVIGGLSVLSVAMVLGVLALCYWLVEMSSVGGAE
jgi:hypothetical protein